MYNFILGNNNILINQKCWLLLYLNAYVSFKEPERPGARGGGGGGQGGGGNGEHAAGMEPMDVADLMPEPKGFQAFSGSGNRLDGRKKRTGSESQATDSSKG